MRDLFAEMSPPDFEHLVADVLQDKGWTANVVGQSGDHGLDIVGTKLDGSVLLVQCKKYDGTAIGPDVVRELLGAREHWLAKNRAVPRSDVETWLVTSFAKVSDNARKTADAAGICINDWSWLRDAIVSGDQFTLKWRTKLGG